MKQDKTLSEKIIIPELPFVISKEGALDVKDVKQFIKDILDEIGKCKNHNHKERVCSSIKLEKVKKIIKQKAGGDLVK